jgi:hypothetical protein
MAESKKILLVSTKSRDPELAAAFEGALRQAAHSATGYDSNVVTASQALGPRYDLDSFAKMGDLDAAVVVLDDSPIVNQIVGGLHASGVPTLLLYDDTGPGDAIGVHPAPFRRDAVIDGSFAEQLAEMLRRNWAGLEPPDGPEVFISYSHVDKAYLDRLLVHLRPLERAGRVRSWADTSLRPGDDWRAEIEQAIDRCSLAVLLVSPDFLASAFVTESELPPILEAAEAKGVRVISVIVEHCGFGRRPDLARFHAMNNPETPLSSLPTTERERIYDLVAQAVESATGGDPLAG